MMKMLLPVLIAFSSASLVRAEAKFVENNIEYGGGASKKSPDPYPRCPDIGIYGTKSSIRHTLIIPYEQNMNSASVAALYFFLLLYFFLGLSIAAHILMLTIESIISKTKKVTVTRIEDGKEVKEEKDVLVWNNTIANLTIIALGVSAPRILLHLIEVFANNMCPGYLGPGLIIGSAAFNLLIVSALCIVSVPKGKKRRIKEYRVFVTTSAFACVAFIWVAVIIQTVTHSVVDVWEGFFTILFYPLMVGVAYWATLAFCTSGKPPRKKSLTTSPLDPNLGHLYAASGAAGVYELSSNWEELVNPDGSLNLETVQRLYDELNAIAVLTDDEIATILATKLIQLRGRSILWYKIRAIQALVAGNRAFPAINDKLQEVSAVLTDINDRGGVGNEMTSSDTDKAVIEFTASSVASPIFAGTLHVIIRRTGRTDITVPCIVETMDGTAKKNFGYLPISKKIVFEPYVMEQTVLVNVVGDSKKVSQSLYNFHIHLRLDPTTENAKLGPMSVMEVVIQEVKDAGELEFTKNAEAIKETVKFADVDIKRVNGSKGKVAVKWKAIPGPNCTRLPAVMEGQIEFEEGQLRKIIQIPLAAKSSKGKTQKGKMTSKKKPAAPSDDKGAETETEGASGTEEGEVKKGKNKRKGKKDEGDDKGETEKDETEKDKTEKDKSEKDKTEKDKTEKDKSEKDKTEKDKSEKDIKAKTTKKGKDKKAGPEVAEPDEQFEVELQEIPGIRGKVGEITKIKVVVANDQELALEMIKLCALVEQKTTIEYAFVKQTYKEQIKSAFIVNGDVEMAKRATRSDKIMHWISLPWKMLFCLLPPPHIHQGYPCFFLTLLLIALLIAIVGDMAIIFGDSLGLHPIATAITLLALGTSFTDAYASRIAAISSSTADAAIGNIMGTICVLLFVGLGLPWTLAAIYMQARHGEGLPMRAEALAFIVMILVLLSIMVFIIFWLRRHSVTFGFAELGGPSATKWLTATMLVLGWCFYIVVALMVLQKYGGFYESAMRFGRKFQLD